VVLRVALALLCHVEPNETFRGDIPAANDATGNAPRLALLPIDQVMKRASIGRTTIYQLIRQGEFSQPVKICGASRWVLGDVTDWIESLMSKRSQGP
jgi:predicted DNA-binding transcriptional regulator AlpA